MRLASRLILAVVVSASLHNAYSAERPRDPWLWPFAADSIWNTPIGAKAVYVPAGLGAAKTIALDHELLYRVGPNAPSRQVFAPLSWETRAGGTKLLGEIRIDDDCVVPDARKGSTPNNCSAFLMPDGRTVRQINPLCRPESGGPVSGWLTRQDVDLFGPGITGCHGGSGLSALGGSIRLGELSGAKPIRHAIKVNIFCEKYAYYGDDRHGFRWPADRADAYAKNKYKGDNPALVMGSLVALPRTVTESDLGLQTPLARKLFRVLQDYGAYVADDAAWDCHYLCAERGVADEIEAAYGMRFNGNSKPLVADVNALFTHLAVVDNNTPTSIGGGGKRRLPPPPPFKKDARR